MSDRGPINLHHIKVTPESRDAVLAVLAEHFDGEVIDGKVTVPYNGAFITSRPDDPLVYLSDEYLDNQDNWGNAEDLLDRLIQAGAVQVRFGLQQYDGLYQFRSNGPNKRIDAGDNDGELYINQSTLYALLNEPGMTLAVLRERLDGHFGKDWNF